MLGLSFSTVGFLSLVLGFLIIKEGDPHQASALLAVQMVFWAIGLLDCEVAIVCNCQFSNEFKRKLQSASYYNHLKSRGLLGFERAHSSTSICKSMQGFVALFPSPIHGGQFQLQFYNADGLELSFGAFSFPIRKEVW